MRGRGRSGSIFAQTLDRAAFLAYLLGAVVPLVALAVVVERFALPSLTDRYAELALLGAVPSIAVLSLAAFLALRRSTRAALERMDRDNVRLSALLQLSGALAEVPHARDAAERAAAAALRLVQARASFVRVPAADGGDGDEVLAVSGREAEKLAEEHRAAIEELTEWVREAGRPAVRAPEAGAPAMAAAPLAREGRARGTLVALGEPGGGAFDASAQDALASLGALTGVALRSADLRDAQSNFFIHATELLVTALDASEGYHDGHGERVAKLANRIGRQLGLDDAGLQRLHFAALLHDIGMIKLSRSQQRDPRIWPRHTVLGARMLARIRLWQDLAPIVRHHHERWDGAGYPDSLAERAIPLESRIIAVCDAVDAMTSASSYKPARSMEDAVNEVARTSGTQFDPDVVHAFLAVAQRGELQDLEAPS